MDEQHHRFRAAVDFPILSGLCVAIAIAHVIPSHSGRSLLLAGVGCAIICNVYRAVKISIRAFSLAALVFISGDQINSRIKPDWTLASQEILRCHKPKYGLKPMHCVKQDSAELPTLHFHSIFERFHKIAEIRWLGLQSFLKYQERSWINTVLLGKIYALPAAFTNWFRVTGLYHLLVVSGFHFAVLLGLMRELAFAFLRAGNACFAWNSRSQFSFVLGVKVAVAIAGYILLQFLGSTPPSQRAFCCFVMGLVLSPQCQRFGLTQRIELSALLHAVAFPTGLISVSGILSWLIYLSVCAAGTGIVGIVKLQVRIFLIVGATFSQCNLAALVLNLFAPLLGTIMMATAIVPSVAVYFNCDQIRYWNLLIINGILTTVGYFSAMISERSEWFNIPLKCTGRWLIALVWSIMLLGRLSSRQNR